MTTDAMCQLKEFDDQYLPFPTFVTAKQAIDEALTIYRETGVARHMLVLGEAGTGKSTLCKLMETQHPRRKLSDRDKIDIVTVSVPPSANVGGVASAVLRSLGDLWHGRGTIASRTERIVTLCRECGVELMLIDEAQHLQDRGTSRTHYMVGDWVKDVIDQVSVPTVMLGLPRLELLLQTNEQLRRRFSRRVRLAFGQNSAMSVETECLQLFLSLSSLLTLPVSSKPFGPQEMGTRLYYACDGRVAYIKKILFSALSMALRHEDDAIDVKHLERAFTDDVWWEGVGRLNPFSSDFVFRRLDRGGEPFQVAGSGGAQ
ncbi:TniB family NTP-binding protein [Diaphorobacter sp.]|uniref:TniB family NTP-binding protein n=1 Tax=Diaphorobacter sp. TaxID=1934310 RepID=UPI0028A7D830|nr:TniB family NTP-binding protein [Diaphorobacter sp.]